MDKPRKELGQHWLHNPASLRAVAEAAGVQPNDAVLEIGPGLGSLTHILLDRGAQVTAVELDSTLAKSLTKTIKNHNLRVVNQDILKFDLGSLPLGYKVVGNIPYYVTSTLIRTLLESTHQPVQIGLLVQKEVAQRLSAQPGQMSTLSVSAQLYAKVSLGSIVPRDFFEPPPAVDSQIISLKPQLLPPGLDVHMFFRIVKAGFGERRKKLLNSLSGGLQLDKQLVANVLQKTGLPPQVRAQELSLEQWLNLSRRLRPLLPSV